MARGYVDREHPIAVRVLARRADERVVPRQRRRRGAFRPRAVQLRWFLLGAARPSAMRVFTGESEGLPGVTVDRHGEFVVVQWLSAGALGWRDELYDAIESALKPRGIYEQRRLRRSAASPSPEPAVRARRRSAARGGRRGRRGRGRLPLRDRRHGPAGRGAFPRHAARLGRRRGARRRSPRPQPVLVHGRLASVHAAKAGAREKSSPSTFRAEGARARAPQLRAVGPRPGAPRGHHGRHDQGRREARVARPPLRHRHLRSADVLARARGTVLPSRAISRRSRRRARPCSSQAELARLRDELDQGPGARLRSRPRRGRRARGRRPAHHRSRAPPRRLPRRPRLPPRATTSSSRSACEPKTKSRSPERRRPRPREASIGAPRQGLGTSQNPKSGVNSHRACASWSRCEPSSRRGTR